MVNSHKFWIFLKQIVNSIHPLINFALNDVDVEKLVKKKSQYFNFDVVFFGDSLVRILDKIDPYVYKINF